jgi:hypothetical protein
MIMGDDIGWFNVSAFNFGIMGYRTPNIDRIAKEGAMFTDWYSEQSCTAGRAAFIIGQSPVRTGLTKVGLPGAPVGLHADDMSVAEALKLGYGAFCEPAFPPHHLIWRGGGQSPSTHSSAQTSPFWTMNFCAASETINARLFPALLRG